MVETIITEGNTVVVLWDGHAVAKDGLGTTTATAGSCEWRNGTVKEAVAFFDSAALTDLLECVSP